MKKLFRILIACILLLALVFLAVKLIPSKSIRSFVERQYSSRFYDRNGNLLYVMPLEEGLRRTYEYFLKKAEEL